MSDGSIAGAGDWDRARAAPTLSRMSERAPMSPPTPDLRRACERNLRVYYVFKLLSEMWLLIPIFIAFLLLDRGLSVGQVALIESPFWLMATLAEVPTGAVADRWGRRVSLLLGAVTTVIAMFAFGLADTLPLILVSYMLWATALTFTSGADGALLYDTLRQLRRERDFERIAGRGAALSAAGVLVATLAGGPVAGAVGMQATVFLSAGTMVLLTATTALFHEPPHRDAGAAPTPYLQGLREAGRTIRATPAVLALMPLGAVLTTCPMVMIILIQPFLLSHDFTVGWEFSLLQVPMWLASVLGGLLAFRLLRLAGMPGALGVVRAAGDDRLRGRGGMGPHGRPGVHRADPARPVGHRAAHDRVHQPPRPVGPARDGAVPEPDGLQRRAGPHHAGAGTGGGPARSARDVRRRGGARRRAVADRRAQLAARASGASAGRRAV